MFGLACGHFFCKSCWKGYLNLKINEEGQKANLVHCMAFKCSVIVDEGVVQQIVDHDVYNKYLRCVSHFDDAYYAWTLMRALSFLLQSYVDDHPYMTWCPGAGCQLALEISAGDRVLAVKCNCGTDFWYRTRAD